MLFSLHRYSFLLLFAISVSSFGCGSTSEDLRDPDAAGIHDSGVPDAGDPDTGLIDAEPEPDCIPERADFWVYDLSVMPPQYVETPATCRSAGNHGLVFVADDIWLDPVTQESVNTLSRAFNESTPADPDKGIYMLTTSTFGEPSDVDDNDRVFLLLLELPSYQGYQFDGYIRREDTLGGTYSNNAEILYLDAVRNDIASEYMLGVVAHEFFHLVHLNHDPWEESWLDESLAQATMILCGYFGDLYAWVPNYTNNPNQMLVDNSPTFHYGAGFLFGGYLLERFGGSYLSALVENTSTGVYSMEETWADLGYDLSFREILGDWAAANWLDEPGLGDERHFGYTAFSVPTINTVGPIEPGVVAGTRTIKPTGALYYEFDVGSLPADSDSTVILVSPGYESLETRVMIHPNDDKSAAIVHYPVLDGTESAFSINGAGDSINRVVLGIVSLAEDDVTIESVTLELD